MKTLNTILLLATAATASAQSTTRANFGPGGVQSDDTCFLGGISANGRFVTSYSAATNLVSPPDTNAITDAFVHDRATGATTRVSVHTNGNAGNDFSYSDPGGISADGRYVAFVSFATNLVGLDFNGKSDVFVRDLATSTTQRVSVSSTGASGNGHSSSPSLSDDGRYVSFSSDASTLVTGDTNGTSDVFLHDRTTGQTIRVSVDALGNQANGSSGNAAMSSDGRFLVFQSGATNLVAGDTNLTVDVFLHDTLTQQIERVSTSSSGTEGNDVSTGTGVSRDGRYVQFVSYASNLVSGDTNGTRDVFIKDRVTGVTKRVNVSSTGVQANGLSFLATLSDDGRFSAFHSAGSTLVLGDTNGKPDAFVHDLSTGVTTRVSVSSSGVEANSGAGSTVAISRDGRSIAFESNSNNLVLGDTNNDQDVFVREVYDVAPATYCTAKTTSHGCVPSIVGVGEPSVAAPGAFSLATSQMENAKNAITFFGTTGFGNPFQGGHLCVKPPLFRLGVKNSGGASACQGAVSYTLAEFLAHGSGGASVVPGVDLYGQTWGRDPGDAFGSSLSNGVTFMVLP